jgi:hypothetical protein
MTILTNGIFNAEDFKSSVYQWSLNFYRRLYLLNNGFSQFAAFMSTVIEWTESPFTIWDITDL